MKALAILISMSLLPPAAENQAPGAGADTPLACSSCDARKAGLKKLYDETRAAEETPTASADDD